MSTRRGVERALRGDDLLVVDVGNSKVQALLVRSGAARLRWRVEYGAPASAWSGAFAAGAACARAATRARLPIVVASVAPARARAVDVILRRLWRTRPFGSYYNIQQAAISIGSGGVTGKGYMSGSQSEGRFLRVPHTDFIFAVISHEFGFVGAMGTMVLLGIGSLRILRGAAIASDPLGSLICYGVGAMIFFQTFVAIGTNLNLMPITGLTLPFVSSGGTTLMFTMVGVGLAESVILRGRHTKI